MANGTEEKNVERSDVSLIIREYECGGDVISRAK